MEATEVEIVIANDLKSNIVKLKIFPFDFLLLDKLLTGFSRARINGIHAILFGDAEDSANDVYIKDDNYAEIIGKISFVKDVVNFFSEQKSEYTINKLDMDCDGVNVFFDDDALLILSFPSKNIQMDIFLFKRIIDSLATPSH